MDIQDDSKGHIAHIEEQQCHADTIIHSDNKEAARTQDREAAIKGEEQELQMTLFQGLRAYPNAAFWSLCISLCIIMEGVLRSCAWTSTHTLLQDTTMPRLATSSQCRSIASALAPMSVLRVTQTTTTSSRQPGNPLLDRPPTLDAFCKFEPLRDVAYSPVASSCHPGARTGLGIVVHFKLD